MAEFQVNDFVTYKVVRDGVSFGFIDTQNGGYNPKQGEMFKYDGSTVILHDGREFRDAPQLRSAIREGWCTEVGAASSEYRPKSAGIQVRPTETRGTDRTVKTTIETQPAEDREVGSVEGRRQSREAANAEATRRVPMLSQEGQTALQSATDNWSSGNAEVDEIALMLGQNFRELEAKTSAVNTSSVKTTVEDDKTRVEHAITDVFDAVENMTRSASVTSRRQMPVVDQDSRLTMPIVRENDAENVGNIVGKVSDQKKLALDREQEFALDVAKATPEAKSPAPSPRFGGVGAIVHDEQRHMGNIALSDNRAAIRLDESATVKSTGNETVRMQEGAQIGARTKVASPAPETDQGVAVGRILSPTHQSFTADARNTSADAIQRTAEGGRVKVEKFDEVPAGKTRVATGDVEEVRSGDTLEEILPDAARPAPEVHLRPEDDPAYAAVRIMLPEFEWNKDRPVRERVKDALTHVKDPMFVKGILAVETEIAREMIKQGLAEIIASDKKSKTKTKAKKARKAKKTTKATKTAK